MYRQQTTQEHWQQFTGMRCLKAHLHVKREGTARLETITSSRRNLLFTRTNSVPNRKRHGT